MTDILKIRTLTEKFFDGETSLQEERVLYEFYRQDDIPDDLRPCQQLFRGLAALDAVAADRQPEPRRNRRGWWRAAAAVAVAVVSLGGALLFRHHSENECVAYFYGERVTDRAVVLDEMQQTMASMASDGSDEVAEQLRAMFDNN